MNQTMRWYGPQDTVKLSDIRQAGAHGVVTALHQVAVGEVWSVEMITERKSMIEAAGLTWTVIESLPVHDDIKKRNGQYQLYISNYIQSLHNIASCGLEVVTYNFMPVLDWLRTDIAYQMPDGSKALYFERAAFVAFDIFMLRRPGAKSSYTASEIQAASAWYNNASAVCRETVFRNCLLGLPGSDESFTAEQVNDAIAGYEGIDDTILRNNLVSFLATIAPVAQSLNLRLAIHPDDPPYAVLGLPRIMSTESDAAALLDAVPLAANGLCFCTGSFGARPDNNIENMLKRFGDRIHFFHLRNTKRDDHGNFFEDDHLAGDTDMVTVVKEILQIMQKQQRSIPMRPDHGHQMLDDLHKTTYPGYSAIGRLRGLAELRGLEKGIARSL